MLTILHTESSLGWGGQENRTLNECVGLAGHGARVIVLCKPGSRLKDRAFAAGLEVRTHPMRSNRDISALLFIMRLIKKESIDVVSTHSGDDSFLGAVAGRLSVRRPKIVRTRHLALPITSKLTYSLLPHKVVTTCDYVRRYLIEEKGIGSQKVVSVPSGVDIKRFDPEKTPDTLRNELGLGPDDLIVGTVAILRIKKGYQYLLDAVPKVISEVPRAFFAFAGDGPQKNNIENKIKKLGLEERVRMLGLRSDVPTVLKGLDLFVLPTLQEAIGTAVLEASAMGKAVIATRVGGMYEAVTENTTGLLVEPEDPESLSAAIIKLLKDGDLRKRMGDAGRNKVLAGFSTDKMAERMFALYSGLTGKS